MELKESINAADHGILTKQLNSGSVRALSVLKRCSHSYPAIILLQMKTEGDCPDYMSLSLLCWLSCPYLNDRIHILETAGAVKSIEALIARDSYNTGLMVGAHERFALIRMRMSREFFPGLALDGRVFTKGIGGVGDFTNIKCLHAHAASVPLCGMNPAVNELFGMLGGKTECDSGICGREF